MLFIVEIMFFIMGLYALVTAKLPAWFVGKGYIAEGSPVRLLSILMIAPLPAAFCAGFTLGIIDPDLVWVASAFEIFSVIAVAVILTITLRKIRIPEPSAQIPEPNRQE